MNGKTFSQHRVYTEYFTIITFEDYIAGHSTPTAPELSWLAILPLFVVMLCIVVIVRLRKQAIKKHSLN